MKFNRSLREVCFRGVIVIALTIASLVSPISGQGVKTQSVVGAGPFLSLEGRFSIALPLVTSGFQPLSVDTAVGKMRGDAYSWKMKEGSFTVGYVDASQPIDDAVTTAKIFAGIRDGLASLASSRNGKVATEKQSEIDKHQVLEVKLEFPQAVFWQRCYVASSRLYQVVLVVRTEQHADEAVAVKVFDTFKILSEAEVSEAKKAKAAAAEPSPLPQEPEVARMGSDAADDDLHGPVKTVYEESEDLSGTSSVQGRKPRSMGYYNKGGNLTKRELYDYKGNLSEVNVYGYIDGARVASSKTIEQSYNPPPVILSSPPGAARPKSDSRYSTKFTFRYDAQKRLTEKTWFQNNGEVRIRYVYKYSGNQREELVYAADGSLNQRYLVILDDKGNQVEETSFDTSDGSIRNKYSYAYEFDQKGNWIKRVTSKALTKDDKPAFVPSSVVYRTITYH